MNGVPHHRGPGGRGRGHNLYKNLEFWEDRPGRNPGSSYVRRDPVSNNFKLHVRSIPHTWNMTIFKNVFSRCGDPKNIFLQPHRGPNTLTWGFVEYETFQEANSAVRELNNNVVLNIQVMFAKEKTHEESDPVLALLSEEDNTSHRSMETLVDPKSLVKTVKNDSTLSSDILIEDFYKPVFDAETQRCIEEALFQKMLDIYKQGECPTARCNVCEVSCSSACSGCFAVYYCSDNCQNRDWDSHSRKCKGGNMGAADDFTASSRGGGDHRQTNGFGSFDSDNRSNKFPERRNNRDSFRDNSRDSGAREDRNANEQGRRSLFEERKARLATSGRQNDNDRGGQNRFGQGNQRSQSGQESRSMFKPRPSARQGEDNWGAQNRDNGAKDSSSTNVQDSSSSNVKDSSPSTPGLDFISKEKAFLQDIAVKKEPVSPKPSEKKSEIKVRDPEALMTAPKVNASTTVEEPVLKPGLLMEVLIYHAEERGVFWVQKTKQEAKMKDLFEQLGAYYSKQSAQSSPQVGSVCGINYENQWYRCRVTSLDPISVIYIDFGYPETVEANRLFELSSELKSLPPFVFRIKLIDGTPEVYLDKAESDVLNVRLVEKVNDSWLAEVVSENFSNTGTLEAATTSTTAPPTAVVAPPEPVATAVVAPPEPVAPAVVAPPEPLAPAVVAPPEPVAPAVVPKSSPETRQITPSAAMSDTPSPGTQKPYPPMLDATKFTTVVVTYPGGAEEKDSYYTGAPTVWNSLAEMCQHFKGAIHHCAVLTPQIGTKGLAEFMGDWYRVEVVSVTPAAVFVFYTDFGNTEPLQPDGLRKCPETHKDIPPLVHKIKLAPGTNEKYFNLKDESEISVKPVAWLPDGTVIVQVEGETYAEGGVQVPGDSGSSTDAQLVASGSVAGHKSCPPEPTSGTSQLSNPLPVGSTSTGKPAPTAVLNELVSSKSLDTVDMLQEKWKISFVPGKVDFVKNSLLGQVYCEHVPATLSFIVENEHFQNYLSSQKFDPNFKPSVGEIVGLCLPTGGWERGQVLSQQGLVALYDIGGVTRCSQLYKLPEEFINVPPMATTFTLTKEDNDVLSRLLEMDDIIFDVVKKGSTRGQTVVSVDLGGSIKGELRSWRYEPLETPDPLAQGESVTISRVLLANTLLVSPASDLEIQQKIQIDCRKSNEQLQRPPIVGDYIAFLDKESDGYFRSRIDKVDGDTFTVYAIDSATYHKTNLGDLHPLPASLRNIPCRISQIELKGVDKLDLTEQAQIYLSHIVEEDKFLTIDIDDDGKATLTVEGEEDTLNSKLRALLTPQVVPNSEGKLTILSLPELGVPLNQEFDFIITQTEPLYVQLVSPGQKYLQDLHPLLQEYCANNHAPYNPCEGELCLAPFEGEWFRGRCLKETNTGVSVIMFVDYGNIYSARTSEIRQILPEMLTMPSVATSCKIHGLPDPVSPALKAKLDEILQPDMKFSGVFVAEKDGCYDVVIESVKKAIEELQ